VTVKVPTVRIAAGEAETKDLPVAAEGTGIALPTPSPIENGVLKELPGNRAQIRKKVSAGKY